MWKGSQLEIAIDQHEECCATSHSRVLGLAADRLEIRAVVSALGRCRRGLAILGSKSTSTYLSSTKPLLALPWLFASLAYLSASRPSYHLPNQMQIWHRLSHRNRSTTGGSKRTCVTFDFELPSLTPRDRASHTPLSQAPAPRNPDILDHGRLPRETPTPSRGQTIAQFCTTK
jgi:hypothetical protein